LIEVVESKGNLLWLRASRRLTVKDYREVMIPLLEKVIWNHGRARLLFQFDPDFQGFEVGALWEDFKFDLKHLGDFERLAIVGGSRWMEAAVKLFAHVMKGEVRTMPPDHLAEAWEWLQDEGAASGPER
jgi:universal stress protein A